MSLKTPKWSETLVKELETLERMLGNLPDAEGKKQDWAETPLQNLQKRIFEQPKDISSLERQTEDLFARICKGLYHEGHSAEMIADFINSSLTPTGGLKYCDHTEVESAIQGS